MQVIALSQYINGQWINGEGKPLQSINPANSALVSEGFMASLGQVEEAYLAAHSASFDWANLGLEKRIAYLRAFNCELEKNQQAIIELISLESGKPLWESLTEYRSLIAKLDISIQAYRERNASQSEQSPEGQSSIRYKPYGVALVLGPFNFPAHLSNGHIIPALLAGNTVIYKPSELTPAVASLIMRLWHQAGIPKGVINCLQGDKEVAQNLMKQDIQALYFTGSYKTGLAINQQMSTRPEVILALEMGGSNPLFIADIADIDAAVYQTILSAFITAGQRCSCARLLFIPENAKGQLFLDRLLETTAGLRVGSYDSKPEAFMGPLIRREQAVAHIETMEKLLVAGAKPLLPMSLLNTSSAFISPGVIEQDINKPLYDEEIFAPLLQIYRYQDFEQAILFANQSKYGLCAGLMSNDAMQYQYFFQNIKAGLINWNRPTTGASSKLPFGGIGKSGNNRPSAYFAADYCSYPIASLEQSELRMPETILPGIKLS